MHIVLIEWDGKKSWESFNSEEEALEYCDELHEQFAGIETMYIIS